MKLTALALSGLVTIVLAAVLVAPALGTDPAGGDPMLQALRTVSARYHSSEQAEAAGYIRASGCESSPAGGMGYHYLNPALAMNPAIDPLEPEVLLYAPKPNGKLELVGVEFFRRAADQTAPFDQSDKPSLFGRTFDGVMPEHAPGMGWHYDLHVWLWELNANGLFNPWNPGVTCP